MPGFRSAWSRPSGTIPRGGSASRRGRSTTSPNRWISHTSRPSWPPSCCHEGRRKAGLDTGRQYCKLLARARMIGGQGRQGERGAVRPIAAVAVLVLAAAGIASLLRSRPASRLPSAVPSTAVPAPGPTPPPTPPPPLPIPAEEPRRPADDLARLTDENRALRERHAALEAQGTELAPTAEKLRVQRDTIQRQLAAAQKRTREAALQRQLLTQRRDAQELTRALRAAEKTAQVLETQERTARADLVKAQTRLQQLHRDYVRLVAEQGEGS